VENLAGYLQVDLALPEDRFGGKPELANRQARVWGLEVNGRVHSLIQGDPGRAPEGGAATDATTALLEAAALPRRAPQGLSVGQNCGL
jgi:hypothetical protein